MGPGEMSYLVHKASVLPALTVQVAIQGDVCKGRAEGSHHRVPRRSTQAYDLCLLPSALRARLGLGKWK